MEYITRLLSMEVHPTSDTPTRAILGASRRSFHKRESSDANKDHSFCHRCSTFVRGCDIPQIANSMSHQKMGGTAIYQIRSQGVFAYKAVSACLPMTPEDERVKHAARMRGKRVFFSATRCVYVFVSSSPDRHVSLFHFLLHCTSHLFSRFFRIFNPLNMATSSCSVVLFHASRSHVEF